MSIQQAIQAYCRQLQEQGLLRSRRLRADTGTDLVFDSSDYLGLRQDPLLALAYQEGYKHYPTGSGGSMVLSGYHPNHKALEEAFAQWLSVDRCLLFSSGYAANIALTALLGQLQVHCCLDKAVHASIYDGLSLSKVTFSRYPTHDITSLPSLLGKIKGHKAVLTEGLFSMSGHRPPLQELAAITKGCDAALLVDEAHALGVMGAEGRGASAHHGLGQTEVPLRVLPFGKAFAASGAIIAGQGEWIEALLQAGRSLIYSTAPSPAQSYGLLHTLEMVAAAEDRRAALQEVIAYFRSKTRGLGWLDSLSPIQYLPLGCPYKTVRIAQVLQEKGILCSAIRAPTVPAKASGIRVSLNCRHEKGDIDALIAVLDSTFHSLPTSRSHDLFAGLSAGSRDVEGFLDPADKPRDVGKEVAIQT